MFSLEIKDLEKWIRATYPDTGWTDMQTVVAACQIRHWVEDHSLCDEYCQGQPVYWERDPHRRAYVCSVCGKTDRDHTGLVYGFEGTPTRIPGWDGGWERIKERVAKYAPEGDGLMARHAAPGTVCDTGQNES